MNAEKARALTAETIQFRQNREQYEAEQARLTREQEMIAREERIAEMAAVMRLEVNDQIEAATKAEMYSTKYVWEQYVPGDQVQSEDDFNEHMDKYAAYVTMANQLELEGFETYHTETNLSSSDGIDGDEHHQYSLLIEWGPKPKKRAGLLKRIGNKVTQIANKS